MLITEKQTCGLRDAEAIRAGLGLGLTAKLEKRLLVKDDQQKYSVEWLPQSLSHSFFSILH